MTVFAWQRECLLGEITSGQVQLRPAGQVVHRGWQRLPSHFPGIELDEFVIMPNHIHGITIINTPVGAQRNLDAIMTVTPPACAQPDLARLNCDP